MSSLRHTLALHGRAARRSAAAGAALALMLLAMLACPIARAATVSGVVFEDIDGNLLPSPEVAGDATNPGYINRSVVIYDASGIQVNTGTTDASGRYSVTIAAAGVYYAVVASPNRTAAGVTGVVTELTYASAGSGNTGTAGGTTGYGALCVIAAPPTFNDQGADPRTNSAVNRASGACYGGRRATVGDTVTTLENGEQVVRFAVTATGNVTGLNFGFSTRVVTNLNGVGQGSLAQFIVNANAVGGSTTKTMRFVPVVPTNAGTTGSTTAAWWRLSLWGNSLPTVTAANTVLDGRAWSAVDGSTQLDYMPGVLVGSTIAGAGAHQTPVPAVMRPELEINQATGGSLSTRPVIALGSASGQEIRNLSLTGGTTGLLLGTSGATGVRIEGNGIGVRPDNIRVPASNANGSGVGVLLGSLSAAVCSPVTGIAATVTGNMIAGTDHAMAHCATGLSSGAFVVEGNHIGYTSTGAAVVLAPSAYLASGTVDTRNLVFRGNVVLGAYGAGFELFAPSGRGAGHQVVGNTINSNGGPGLWWRQHATTGAISGAALVQGNAIESNAGAGVRIDAATGQLRQIEITRNRFLNNTGNAIDLNANGVSTGTGCAADTGGAANGNLGRPTLSAATLASATSLVVSGAVCATGSYRIEFYRATAGSGDSGGDTLPAGEGSTFLGETAGVTGGAFTARTVTIASGALNAGDAITAIAVREDGASAGDTSEFSAQVTPSPSVAGLVFEDVAGNLLADGEAAGDAVNPGISGVPVRLYSSSGALLHTTTTGTGGAFLMPPQGAGTFYVAVSAPTRTATGTTGVLLEQTYAVAGSGHAAGSTAGGAAGWGSLCVAATPPAFVDQGASVTANAAANPVGGACYGGRRGANADAATGLDTSEHVVRVIVGSATAVSGVSFGFSGRVVTHTAVAGQGSLHQFIANANAVAGTAPKTMRFVPAVPSNQGSVGSTGSAWWRIDLAGSLLPAIGAHGTVIDGRAWSAADGLSQLDYMTGNLEEPRQVGAPPYRSATNALPRPELELAQVTHTPSAPVNMNTRPVLVVDAGIGVQIRHLSVTGGSEGIKVSGNGVADLLVESNAIGWRPDGSLRQARSSSLSPGLQFGTLTQFACAPVTGLTVRVVGNAITGGSQAAVNCATGLPADALTYRGNVMREVVFSTFTFSPLQTAAVATQGLLFQNNFVGGGLYGMRLFVPAGTGGAQRIVGNTFSGTGTNAISFARRSDTTPTNHVGTMTGIALVEGNVFTNAGLTSSTDSGAGISVDNDGTNLQQVWISRNEFSANRGPGIDLGANGVSTGTGCSTGGAANGGLGRPVVASARLTGATTLSVSGTYCNNAGTYTLEFYKAEPGTGDTGGDGQAAGEGRTYLGALTGLTGGSFGNLTVTMASGAVAVDDAITAIAIREDGDSTRGNTSEFSANATVQGLTIAGTVFEDIDGNLLAAGAEAVGDAANPGMAGVAVRLYDAAGSQVASTTTGPGGAFAFARVYAGTYHVAVAAPDRTAAGTTGTVLEQTYAAAGTGHGGERGGTSGWGSLCVRGSPPTYTAQDDALATNVAANPASGACYGGRRGAVADTAGTLGGAEHVLRVVVLAGDIAGANFGFSARVVSNVNRSGQGSLHQFITNANAMAGAAPKTMRFVPAVPTNQGTGTTWWRIGLGGIANALPVIAASGTVIDGRAWSLADGSTLLDYMPGDLVAGRTVGTGAGLAGTRPAVPSPELEVNQINSGVSANTAPVLSVGSSDGVQIRFLSITGGTSGVLVAQSNVTNLLIEGNVIGRQPNGNLVRASSTDTGAGNGVQFGSTDGSACTPVDGIRATVRGNSLSGVSQGAANCVNGLAVNDLVYEGNTFLDIGGSGLVLSPYAGAAVATQNLVVRNNSFLSVANHGLRFFTLPGTGSGHQIIGNEFSGNPGSSLVFANATGASSGSAATTTSAAVVVLANTISGSGTAAGSTGAGVQIANAASLQRIRITQNSFSGNAGPAIDLNAGGVSTGTGCNAAGGSANGNLGRPTLSTAAWVSATRLRVSGTYCSSGTYTIEFYRAAAGSGDIGSDGRAAGEGQVYLGALTGRTGGIFNNQALDIASDAVGAGDAITAIAIREDGDSTQGNTSEFSANAAVVASAATLLLRATTSGGTGTFAFAVSNADTVLSTSGSNESSASLMVTTAGVATPYDADPGVAGTQSINVLAAGTAVVVSHAVTAGRRATAASCTDGASTFSAPGLPLTAGSTATVTITAPNVTAGSSWTCDFTVQVGAPPQLTLRVITTGGSGSVEFTGSNGLPSASPGLVVSTSAPGAATDSAATVLTTSHASTTVQQVATSAWALNTASCMDRNAAVTGNPAQFGTLAGQVITIAAARVTLDADIVCTFTSSAVGSRITGRVFRDSGTGGGTANDSLQNGGEIGVPGATVRLTNCGSTVHASATTDGSGDYSLPTIGVTGLVCVEQAGLAGHLSTGANVGGVVAVSGVGTVVSGTTFTYYQGTDRFQFTLAGSPPAGLNFADVPPHRLHADGARVAQPGTLVQYPHQFVAASAGTVAFSVTAVSTPAPGWTQTIYQDTNCSADLDASDTVMAPGAPQPMTEGQTLCVLVVQAVPHGVPAGATSQLTLSAGFVHVNASPALSATLTRTDTTTVSLSTLELAKRVRNVTQGASTFSVSNQARSGDELEYQVTYRNNGAGPIGTLVVRDSTPAYSSFVSASCGTPLPAGLSACVLSASPGVSTAGAIVWTFTGTLGGGLQGTVLFRVRVD